MRCVFTYSLVFVTLLFISGCSNSATGTLSAVQAIQGWTMGTTYHIKYVAHEDLSASMQADVDSALLELNQTMSTYIVDSELNRLNAHAVGDWMSVSRPLFTVIKRALELSRLSSGAFDISVGPLVDLWGFGPTPGSERVPERQALELAKQKVGYQAIELDETQLRIRKSAPRRLDLSAIAKGYGVDMIAVLLEQQGINDYLVEIGGEIRLKGKKPNGELWRIAIEAPVSNQREAMKVLPLSNHALATSGDYRNYFEVDGKRYSHTIDPVSGYPIRHTLVSATVISDNCMDADGWATTMMVLGVEPSLVLAEQQQLAVLLLEKTATGFTEHKSSAFSKYLIEP